MLFEANLATLESQSLTGGFQKEECDKESQVSKDIDLTESTGRDGRKKKAAQRPVQKRQC